MISGRVDSSLSARVQLRVRAANGRFYPVDAEIDTAYDGDLTLPPTLVAALGLTATRRSVALFASGNTQPLVTYDAEIEWGGSTRMIEVDETNTNRSSACGCCTATP